MFPNFITSKLLLIFSNTKKQCRSFASINLQIDKKCRFRHCYKLIVIILAPAASEIVYYCVWLPKLVKLHHRIIKLVNVSGSYFCVCFDVNLKITKFFFDYRLLKVLIRIGKMLLTTFNIICCLRFSELLQYCLWLSKLVQSCFWFIKWIKSKK